MRPAGTSILVVDAFWLIIHGVGRGSRQQKNSEASFSGSGSDQRQLRIVPAAFVRFWRSHARDRHCSRGVVKRLEMSSEMTNNGRPLTDGNKDAMCTCSTALRDVSAQQRVCQIAALRGSHRRGTNSRSKVLTAQALNARTTRCRCARSRHFRSKHVNRSLLLPSNPCGRSRLARSPAPRGLNYRNRPLGAAIDKKKKVEPIGCACGRD